MLIEFKVANFRSIREEQTFSLVASSDKELSACVVERELPGLLGTRFLKGAAIYGANASGKSNVIEAIYFLSQFVRRSATKIQPGDPTGVKPFKLDRDSEKMPSKFEVTFVAEGVRYVFGLSLNTKRVVEEYLIAYPRGVPQRWYHRSFNFQTNEYEWTVPSASFKQGKILQDKTRENSLFLSVGPQFNHEQLTVVYNWFKNNLKIVHLSADAMLNPRFTAKLIEDQNYRNRILNLLKSADIGVTDVNVKEREISIEELKNSIPPSLLSKIEADGPLKTRKQVEISLAHQGEGIEPVMLDFDDEESAGTRRYFWLIGPWLDILDNGFTVFVDEIDTSLHPNLVKELLKLLFCDKNNPKGAQIVFTTHNPVLLDTALFRRDQIWFTEKSPSGATQLYPLTDYKPRKGESLIKGYLAGRYGAIPFLPDGLTM